jgi:trans-2,3-dihydro-3-hydroxyanthranilate isomerase
MFVRTVLWDLEDSPMTIASLRDYLRDESVDAFAAVPGLRWKVWIANDETNTWGATFVWDSREAMLAAQPLPSRAKALIGKDPSWVTEYEVEATIEGLYAGEADLSRRGRVYDKQ